MRMLIRKARAGTVFLAVLAIVGGTWSAAGAAEGAGDKQIARSAALRQRDLGPGWTSTKHTEEPPPDIPACEGTNRASDAAEKYEYRAPDFEQGDSKVTNVVFVFPTVKQAKAYLRAYQRPEALTCFEQGLATVAQDEPGVRFTVEELDVSGGPADDGVGYRADLRASAPDGSTATFVFQAVAFRVGRGVTAITTQNPDVAFPDTADLALTSIKRLRKGLK